MIIKSGCTPPCTPDFRKALCHHALIKYDRRVSVKDYRRAKIDDRHAENLGIRFVPLTSMPVSAVNLCRFLPDGFILLQWWRLAPVLPSFSAQNCVRHFPDDHPVRELNSQTIGENTEIHHRRCENIGRDQIASIRIPVRRLAQCSNHVGLGRPNGYRTVKLFYSSREVGLLAACPHPPSIISAQRPRHWSWDRHTVKWPINDTNDPRQAIPTSGWPHTVNPKKWSQGQEINRQHAE